MNQSSPQPTYDAIGAGYRRFRVPDPRIARQIREAIGNANTVCNVGAGTGSYEPDDLHVVAVEPSRTMIEQRDDAERVICASAENLPFENGQFDVAMAVLTVHHWSDAIKGLQEMRRISRRQVVLTFVPTKIDSLWLVRDYFPEFAEFDRQNALSIDAYGKALNICSIVPVMIPWDCEDGFLAAYWRRPQRYLDQEVRGGISCFAQMSSAEIAHRIQRLTSDLASNQWNERNAAILDREQMDYGYRLIVAANKNM